MATGSIYLRNRPIRTAYVIDLDSHAPGSRELNSILDGIVSYAVEHWGARSDSIHFYRGSSGFTDVEWFDLEQADPDRIYTYSNPTQGNLERLHRLRPWSINVHLGFNPDLEANVPMLPGVSVIPTFETLALREEPLLLLAFSHECAPFDRSFLHRNFGSYRQWADARVPERIRWMGWLENLFKYERHLNCRITYQDSVIAFFSRLAGNLSARAPGYRQPMRFVSPLEISAGSTPASPSWNWSQGFNVYVGDSPELFAAYWADTRTPGIWTAPFRHRLWIPTTVFGSLSTPEALGSYLWQYSGSHSSNSRQITFVSDEAAFSAVEVRLPFMAQGPHRISASHRKLADWETARRQKVRTENNALGVKPVLNSTSARAFRLLEDKQTLSIERPPNVRSPDDSWAVEVQIDQDATDEVGKRTNFVFLPKERGSDLAPLIFKETSRVDRDRLFIVKVGSGSGSFDRATLPELEVSQIFAPQLILAIISGRSIGFDGVDARYSRIVRVPSNTTFAISEPGRHLRSILSLFGDLEKARNFTDREFWWKVFQFLSGSRNRQDEKLQEQVQNLFLKKLLPSLGRPASEKLAESLAQDTVRLVQARASDRYMTLARMSEIREEIAARPPPSPNMIDYGSSQFGIRLGGVEPVSATSVEGDLAYLIDRDILHLGISLKCPSCSGSQWYPAKNLGQRVECTGCGHSHPLPPNPEWSYKVNSLIRRGASSGTMFVLQALRELANRASYSFYYSPSLDVHVGGDLVGELDIVCLVNGELVLGEAKSGRPKQTDLDHFKARMIDLRPDRAIVFVSTAHLEAAKPIFEDLRTTAESNGIAAELFSLPLY